MLRLSSCLVLTCVTAGLADSQQAVQRREASPFGLNVFVCGPATPAKEIQTQIDRVYAEQQHSEFGAGRYAFLFLPGQYKVDVPIGF